MNRTTAETAAENTETKCDPKEGACSLTLALSKSEREKIEKLLGSNLNEAKERISANILAAAFKLTDEVVGLLSPTVGPFSGLRFDDLRDIVNFVRDVDTEHGMGVEALDVILGEVMSLGHPSEFNVRQAIGAAICEWDL